MGRSLFAWKGAPLSYFGVEWTSCGRACASGTGAGSTARPIDDVTACRVFASAVPQQGHLAARNFSILRNLRPAATNSDAGMILAGSTGLALKKVVAPGSD